MGSGGCGGVPLSVFSLCKAFQNCGRQSVGDKARIIKIDIDRNPQAAAAYQVQSVPTLMLFKNGNVLWRQSGVVPAHFLQQVINEHA